MGLDRMGLDRLYADTKTGGALGPRSKCVPSADLRFTLPAENSVGSLPPFLRLRSRVARCGRAGRAGRGGAVMPSRDIRSIQVLSVTAAFEPRTPSRILV